MASNFDFLKEIDEELFSIIIDSERLFRDGYFNQCAINTRIFAETLAKKMYGKNSLNNGIQMTFDDILNCLKDNISDVRQKEIIDDMFFIKQEGNKCAHGQDCESTTALEIIKRAFEISINHCYTKNPDVDKLTFDCDLLIFEKSSKKPEDSLAQKYAELATLQKENDLKKELLDEKERKFKDQVKKEDFKEHFKKDYKEKNSEKIEKNETKKRIKQRIKEAKKELKNTINSTGQDKKSSKKAEKKTETKAKTKAKQKQNKNSKKTSSKKKTTSSNSTFAIIFYIFALIALYILSKLIFFI